MRDTQSTCTVVQITCSERQVIWARRVTNGRDYVGVVVDLVDFNEHRAAFSLSVSMTYSTVYDCVQVATQRVVPSDGGSPNFSPATQLHDGFRRALRVLSVSMTY